MTKIDQRKNYYLILDVETANSLDDPLVYDIGYAIIDKKGFIYEQDSLLIYEIFILEQGLMQSAYYAEKVPMYDQQLKDGKHRLVKWWTAYNIIKSVSEKYNIRGVVAHNAKFDYKALNTTMRYLTKSKYRYFLPYGKELYCTMTMAQSILKNRPSYINFCLADPESRMTKHKKPRPRMTAEIIYRFISGNFDFIESHTGLEDVLIEKEIFAYCIRQKQKMQISPWKN